MRPIIYTFLLFILFTTSSYAQTEGVLHNRFGIRYGVNVSSFNGSPSGDAITPKEGLYLAAYYQFRLKHNIGLSAEMGYSRLGCNNTYGAYYGVSGAVTALRLNYITLPISLKFYIAKGFNFQLGLYGASLLNAVEKGTANVYNGYNSYNNYYYSGVPYNQALDNYFTHFDAGFHTGVAFETALGINFTLKYFNSLVNIYPQFPQATGKSLHNEFLQLTMGYSFHNN